MGKLNEFFNKLYFEIEGQLEVNKNGLVLKPENPVELIRLSHLLKKLDERGYVLSNECKKKDIKPSIKKSTEDSKLKLEVDFKVKGEEEFRGKAKDFY